MILRMNHNTTIEDLRHHSPQLVQELRQLLAAGVGAFTDSHRKDFYEVENEDRVFYIHLRPNGHVWLLAVWPRAGSALDAAPVPALAYASPR